MANLYDTDYFSNWNNQNINNQNINNQNNAGLFDYRNALGDNWALPYAPQDINTPLRDNIPFEPNQGNIPYVPQEKKGFSFDPRNWGVMGLMKRMVEPNTPEENFGRGYFNMDSSGRTYGNQAHDVFAGKNVVSAFGQGMGAAAQKRIDNINATLAKWEADKKKYAERLRTTTLYDRRKKFQDQLNQYNQDFGGATTGDITTTGNVVTNVTSPNVGGDGASRDQGGGYSTRGGFTGTRGQEPGTRGGATSGSGRGHHSWRAQGGRIGYALGTPDPDEPAEDIFEVIKDQNIPVGEQVQGDPFDLRIQELMGKGLSYEDAYDIAAQEFQALFAAGSDQDQGLASLV